MKLANKTEFAQVIRATFDNYSRPSPLPETLRVWWALFGPYSIEQFRIACQRHMRMEPKFPPSSGQLLELIAPTKADGFLGADEAWANSLTSRDERQTVVWDDAQAEAFAICRPVLDSGDEVGARMAFKDAYQRIVSSARAAGKTPNRLVSLGWDEATRTATLRTAVQRNLLPAPAAAAYLPAPFQGASFDSAKAKENLAKVRAMLSGMTSPIERTRREREAKSQVQREAMSAAKSAAAAKVRDYQAAAG